MSDGNPLSVNPGNSNENGLFNISILTGGPLFRSAKMHICMDLVFVYGYV